MQRDQGGSFAASLCLFLLAEERDSPCFRRGGGKIFRAVNNCSPTKGRWLFESKCIEHAVCRLIAAKNTIAGNGVPEKGLGPSKKGHFAQAQNRSFLSGAVTFFRKESMQRLARGYTSLACRLGRCSTFATGKQHPLTPAVYTATRQSEQSSVAVEGGAV